MHAIHPGSSTSTYRKTNPIVRAAQTTVPFAMLYKPLSQPVAIASGTLRSFCCLQQLMTSIQKGNKQAVPAQLAMTVLSVMSVAGSILAHPMGMILSTGFDLVSSTAALVREAQAGNNRIAFEYATYLANNLLYAAVFFSGSAPVTTAYYGAQALSGLYYSLSAFKNGNYIEGTGHAVMTMLRGSQFHAEIEKVQQVVTPAPEAPQPLTVEESLPTEADTLLIEENNIPLEHAEIVAVEMPVRD